MSTRSRGIALVICVLALGGPAWADGISNTGGTVPVATSSTLGGVKPDGTTITNTAGAISVTYGAASNTAVQGNDSRLTALAVVGPTTWTPSDQSGATLTLTVQQATYFQIGKLVTVNVDITWPSTANGSSASIGGLPVASYNGGTSAAGGVLNLNSGPSGFSAVAVISNGTSFIITNLAGTAATNAQMSTARIRGSFTYFTN